MPIVFQITTIQTVPLWLSQGGKGSYPLYSYLVRRDALVRNHRWGATRPDRDGNYQTPWEEWFFKLPQSSTSERGSFPVRTTWARREALAKSPRWASRDYALRKIADDWFFGASSTFGRPIERNQFYGLAGWGGWPLRSRLVTRVALTREHRHGNDNPELSELQADWFFGRTVGSEDMHIRYTRGYYP